MHSMWYVSVISAAYNSKLGLMICDKNSSSLFNIDFLSYVIKQLQNNRIKTVLSTATCLQTRLQRHLEAARNRVKYGNFLNFPRVEASDNLKWTYDGASERFFGSGRGV